jgi:putative ABC transport system permease protein
MNFLLWLRFALKNLRSGLKGFWIFLSCLTLGVAAIAIIGSLGASLERGMKEQGQPLLGGDLEYSIIHREVKADEMAFIKTQGDVSRVATLRAMATAKGGSTLVEIKAADALYPMYGTLELDGGTPRDVFQQKKDGAFQVFADPLLKGRLGLQPGDRLKIGSLEFVLADTIKTEPDRLADGIVLGPRLIMSHEALQATGLIQPGSLVTWRYRVKLPGSATLQQARAASKAAEVKFPDAGWRVRTRDNAAQGADRFVERLSYFMTLVSIASLVIGGAGIANAVSAFVNRRMGTIATLKCLGIANRDIVGTFLTEIILVGLIGIAIGLGAGAVAPRIISSLFGDILPLPIANSVEVWPLAFAGVLGLLVTLAFVLWPLARIARVQGAALFRSQLMESNTWPKLSYMLTSLALIALAALLIFLNFEQKRVTLQYLGGLLGGFVGLAVLAYALVRLAKALPAPSHVLLRHAIQSLYRPGSSAIPVIMALGLGLSLFVALALTDQTLSRELRAGIPDKAPAFFFLDVRNEDLAKFSESLKQDRDVGSVDNAPMLRGRIVSVKGVATANVKSKPEASWALRGDRGLTYAEVLPTGSKLVEGQWWAKDYEGPPLVSMSKDIAEGIGIKIGDKIAVNVLGRDIEATVHNLREVNWRSMGINFVMVFSPNTLRAAPHSHLVTVQMEKGDEAALLNRIAQAYPSVTAVRVKDALATVSDLLGKMLAAVRGANVITLLTGILVLAGALAAGLSTRSYEAVVLKTYGASRRQLMAAFALEYGVLGLVSAVFGCVVGSIAAWALARFILEMPFEMSVSTAVATALMAMVLTVLAGLIVTWRALSAKPSDYLRND